MVGSRHGRSAWWREAWLNPGTRSTPHQSRWTTPTAAFLSNAPASLQASPTCLKKFGFRKYWAEPRTAVTQITWQRNLKTNITEVCGGFRQQIRVAAKLSKLHEDDQHISVTPQHVPLSNISAHRTSSDAWCNSAPYGLSAWCCNHRLII